jgi:hypothetical protein
MNGALNRGSGATPIFAGHGTRAKENAMTCATDLHQAEAAALRLQLDEERLAYITTMSAGEARKRGIIPADTNVAAQTPLYVLRDSDGQVLGCAETWETVYGNARRNDFKLVSVH